MALTPLSTGATVNDTVIVDATADDSGVTAAVIFPCTGTGSGDNSNNNNGNNKTITRTTTSTTKNNCKITNNKF